MSIVNRRHFLVLATGALAARLTHAVSNNKFISGRIVPEHNRTRITLETDERVKIHQFTMNNPPRLVVDMEGIEQNQSLTALSRRVQANDAYVKAVRIGKKSDHSIRVVFDLKQPVNVKIATLNPTGSLKHRIQLDLTASNSGASSIQNTTAAQSAPNNNATANKTNEDPLMDLVSSRQQQKNAANNTRGRKPIIVVDAGHGGKDPGTTGPAGTTEKSVVLATSLELKRQLESKGFIVYMTRDGDHFVPLRDRRQRSRRVNADIFLSVHANASEESTLRGADVFVWGRSNSERARQLAQAENNADYVDGIPSVGNKDVDMILTDMMQAQTTTDSTRLGNLILHQMARHTKLRKNSVETGDFVVLRSVDIPSVLIELGFLSNPDEEKLLASQAHRRKLAASIADAVQQYLRTTTR